MSKGNSEPILAFSVPKASVCALGTPEPCFLYQLNVLENFVHLSPISGTLCLAKKTGTELNCVTLFRGISRHQHRNLLIEKRRKIVLYIRFPLYVRIIHSVAPFQAR